MFATVHLRGATQDQMLTVPTEAVIKTALAASWSLPTMAHIFVPR